MGLSLAHWSGFVYLELQKFVIIRKRGNPNIIAPVTGCIHTFVKAIATQSTTFEMKLCKMLRDNNAFPLKRNRPSA